MHRFLTASPFIDSQHPDVLAAARRLAAGAVSPRQVAERCFEFVRDEIRHSADFQLNPVTCKASDVLHHRTGFCYAKSHLLAALLRANGIPAGLCYQRLSADDSGTRFCLHGLNAVYLPEVGWYRVDPRGDKPGIASRFCPPEEVLAYAPSGPQERDLPEIWAEPLPVVTEVLARCNSYAQVLADLPDVDVLPLVPLVQPGRGKT
jgi:transglutaminase-like putative cysteine protease